MNIGLNLPNGETVKYEDLNMECLWLNDETYTLYLREKENNDVIGVMDIPMEFALNLANSIYSKENFKNEKNQYHSDLLDKICENVKRKFQEGNI